MTRMTRMSAGESCPAAIRVIRVIRGYSFGFSKLIIQLIPN